MTEIVVDTNVWAMLDKTIADVNTLEELDCIENCKNWLKAFVEGEDKLVLDLSYKILLEYRKNIKQGGLAQERLNQLESQPRDRLIEVEIELDENGDAILPVGITFNDRSDRKFIAVAIQFDPYAPIYNATESDWYKEKDQLLEVGIEVHELCTDYVEKKYAEKKK